MRVLFLDFDGVINCHDYLCSLDKSDPDYHPDHRLCAERVERVNWICEATGAKVVVSSAWRFGRSPDDLQALLESRGFTGEVIDKTGSDNGVMERGETIDGWLDRHVVDRFCIIDDAGGSCMEPLTDHLVQTSYEGGGLTDAHVEQAVEMLGGKT